MNTSIAHFALLPERWVLYTDVRFGGTRRPIVQHFGLEPVGAVTRAGLRGTANGQRDANVLLACFGRVGLTTTTMTRQHRSRPDYAAMADILTRIAAELRQQSPPSDDDQNRRQAERLERIVAEIRAYLEE